MIVRTRQIELTALILSLLISCNSDGDASYHEPVKKKPVATKNTTSNDFDRDVEFTQLVADNSLLEMQLAALAIDRSASDTLKGLAVSLMTDYTILNNDVRDLAQRRGLNLPNSLSQKGKTKYNVLADKSADEFDSAYYSFLIREREAIIRSFKEEAETGNDPELKDWATRKIVILERHLAAVNGMK